MKRTLGHIALTLAAGTLFVAGTAVAQNSNTSGAGAGVVDPGHPRVNQVNNREQNQQNRIANGMKSGKLNSQQATHLEKGETRLQNNQKKDMAANNGHLTKQNQRQLNREANRMSGKIATDKGK